MTSIWSGYMRLGLTQINPDTHFQLPMYALPDLVSMGPSWACAIITKTTTPPSSLTIYDFDNQQQSEDVSEQNQVNYGRHSLVVQREGSMIRTPRGLIHANIFLPFGGKGDPALTSTSTSTSASTTPTPIQTGLPTDIGSRIGVMYVPTKDGKADMHFIINGVDQGPASLLEIPYTEAPLYVVLDVYGATKRVRIVDTDGVDSLQSQCRNVILKSLKTSGVCNLPLPPLLKNYLLFSS